MSNHDTHRACRRLCRQHRPSELLCRRCFPHGNLDATLHHLPAVFARWAKEATRGYVQDERRLQSVLRLISVYWSALRCRPDRSLRHMPEAQAASGMYGSRNRVMEIHSCDAWSFEADRGRGHRGQGRGLVVRERKFVRRIQARGLWRPSSMSISTARCKTSYAELQNTPPSTPAIFRRL